MESPLPPETRSSRRWTVTMVLGAVASAFLASLCCLGPLVLAALGLGGAGLLMKFEPYRTYLTGLTLALLGIAFYFTYRKPRPVSGTECDCGFPGSNRLGRVTLWLATILVVGFLAYPRIYGASGSQGQVSSGTAISNEAEVTLEIEGMTCNSCAVAVQTALAKLEGVKGSRVSFQERRAVVGFDSAHTSPEKITDAVTGLGYRATILFRPSY